MVEQKNICYLYPYGLKGNTSFLFQKEAPFLYTFGVICFFILEGDVRKGCFCGYFYATDILYHVRTQFSLTFNILNTI